MKELQDKYTGTYADIAQMHCIVWELKFADMWGSGFRERLNPYNLHQFSALDAADPLFADKLIGNYKTDVK
ncbi:unnamed protein product, partial [Notodromas monacha]